MEETQKIQYQVGEAWKGTYNSSTNYSYANVVQDPTGLSVYRSLKNGNAGHALTDTAWWFKIINMSGIKEESDRINALNTAIAQDEQARVAAEASREQQSSADHTTASADHATAQSDHATAASDHATAQSDHAIAYADHQTAISDNAQYNIDHGKELEREESEALREQAEAQRAIAENNRVAAESERNAQYTIDHGNAVSDHSTYVSDHATAAADHTQASNDHTACVDATAKANNVNATIDGMVVTITDKNGVATSVNIGFDITKTYASVAAMNADAANVDEGIFVMIATTDTTSVENARLYVRNSNAASSSEPFTFLCDLDQAATSAWADWFNNYKPTIENDHTTASADHGTASNDHTTAQGDHTQASTDHSTASSDHTQAVSDHGTAAEDHTQAVSDHGVAVDDHAQYLVDHASIADKVSQSEMQEALEDYARTDGFYESMGVGTAVNLAGQIERTNNSMYRTSGGDEDIATGTARIEKISGNTVVWNQKYNSGRKSDIIVWEGNGKGHIDSVTNESSNIYDLEFVDTISGHKYYIYCSVVANTCTNGTASFMFRYTNPTIVNRVISPENLSFTTKAITESTGDYMTYRTYTDFTASGVLVFYQLIDLTLIYGAGNEPSTVEQFEADYKRWFGKPLTYEPYDEGSLRSVQMSGLKTTGFNQWDEEWELGFLDITTGAEAAGTEQIRAKNYIPVLPSTTYYLRCGLGVWLALFDRNKSIIATDNWTGSGRTSSNVRNVANSTFTTSSNAAYARFYVVKGYGATYNNDICINLSWSGVKNGTYEPYEEHTISIPTTTMTGKLNGEGESVVIFPDGMKGVGDVKDELYYVGGKTYAVKRIGRVDLGSLDWMYYPVDTDNPFGRIDSIGISSLVKLPPSGENGNILCSKYVTAARIKDKSITLVPYTAYGNISVSDSSYTDATTFKAAMNGVYLDYELAEPLVYEVDDFASPARYQVNDWGTEEQLQASGANGVAAIIGCLYGVNAVDLLRRLPENYISKESMDNFLAALGTAMGGTWTKQWNELNEEFDFSFVANSAQEDNTENLEPNNGGE